MTNPISEIMTTEVVWVEPNEKLHAAYQLMRNFDVRHLPVVEPGTLQLKGILSEGDIIIKCTKDNHTIEISDEVSVEEAMTSDVIFCFPESDLANVAATMIAAKIDAIPVVEEDTLELAGIVTTTDFLDQICIDSEINGKVVRPYEFRSPDWRPNLNITKKSG